jgi:hypothetical protein
MRINIKLGFLMPCQHVTVPPYIRRAVYEGLGVKIHAEFCAYRRYFHVDVFGDPSRDTEQLVKGFVMGLLFSMGIETV